MTPILLDTCALIWTTDRVLSPAAQELLIEADASGGGVYVSPISAWELGLLVSKGRLTLPVTLDAWFAKSLAMGLKLTPLTTDILINASFLPGAIHNDPADRIMAATARANGFRLMTRDRPLLAYAEAGHLQAIPC